MPKNQADFNALRSVARQCNEEIQAALKATNNKQFNETTTPIITKYHNKITPKFSRIELIHAIGVLNGQYQER